MRLELEILKPFYYTLHQLTDHVCTYVYIMRHAISLLMVVSNEMPISIAQFDDLLLLCDSDRAALIPRMTGSREMYSNARSVDYVSSAEVLLSIGLLRNIHLFEISLSSVILIGGKQRIADYRVRDWQMDRRSPLSAQLHWDRQLFAAGAKA